MQRLRAEREAREREEKLTCLVNSAMDAIIELDHSLRVTRINPAAEKAFQCETGQVVGRDFIRFLTEEGRTKLLALIDQLKTLPEGQRALWIPGGLKALCPNGKEFPAEATLSQFEMARQTFYTLILRNVHDRQEAERTIHALTKEAVYLREELRALRHFDAILGRSDQIPARAPRHPAGGGDRCDRVDPGRDRHRQGADRAGPSTTPVGGAIGRLSR
ncbi:MAG: hypothetical protein KatS3mg082_0002 [Nitrospiraceae bacterium]|nr:MAG: hypothetical protein KatS3mg082_0002 [Nitrospiraceae bacterium]